MTKPRAARSAKKPPARTPPGTAAVAPALPDREVPTTFVGKLEANYYCRGWNAKRTKYCKARAGSNTAHPGVGRCHQHGGLQADDARVTSGRYRLTRGPRLATLIDEYKADPDPLNVLEELALARALLHDFVERYEQYAAALIAWHAKPDETAKPRAILDVGAAVGHVDVISKVIARVEQARAANAVSRPELLRIMTELARIAQVVVTDDLRDDAARAERILRRISDGWLAVRL